jgi:hypothetical protein
VDSRAGLDDVKNREFLTLQGLKLRSLGLPARSQSLYRLGYHVETAYSSEKFVIFYQTVRRHIPEKSKSSAFSRRPFIIVHHSHELSCVPVPRGRCSVPAYDLLWDPRRILGHTAASAEGW